MSGSEKYEQMAIMEAAISSALSHPNVVQVVWVCICFECQTSTKSMEHLVLYFLMNQCFQTYTYELKPVGDAACGGSLKHNSDPNTLTEDGTISSDRDAMNKASRDLELRLVLEFCDAGSLRDALNQVNIRGKVF